MHNRMHNNYQCSLLSMVNWAQWLSLVYRICSRGTPMYAQRITRLPVVSSRKTMHAVYFVAHKPLASIFQSAGMLVHGKALASTRRHLQTW